MERLGGEARDRVRAASLWLVVGVVVVGVIVGIYATLVGFRQVTTTDAEVLEISLDGRQVTVEFAYGGCRQPAGVEVDEDEDLVLLTARVAERVPLGERACTADLGIARETVELREPVGDRELRVADPSD